MLHLRGGGVLLGLILILACGGDSPPADEGPPPPLDDASPVMPLALADIAPGDTAAILSLMQHTMAEGDAALSTLERRDTILLSAASADSQRITLWRAGDTPVKLTWTAPPEPGRVPGEVAVWFVNGDVQVVLEPFDGYFFDADRIILWTDPSLIPQEITEAERMPREKAVVDSVRVRLGLFGVTYP